MIVTVSPDCLQLEPISVSGQTIVARNDTNPQDRPPIVTDVINLFNSGQFWSILPYRWANLDLSIALAG